jgi:glycosyltransferase involved in cell wall biosynthesis
MKILLSAFAFSPLLGSECGVGWHWALALAKRHDVTVLTHAWFKTDVEAELARNPVPGLTMAYFHAEPFWTGFQRSHLDSQVYVTYWQARAPAFARGLHAQTRFDVVHHLTHGTIRYPCWLGSLDATYIAGPMGGGERASPRFFRGTPWKARLREFVRDAVLYSFCIDPFAQRALSHADVLFCKTADTARFIPRRMQNKVVVAHEIGSPSPLPKPQPVRKGQRTQFLFAGRLLAWKGVHLAVDAIAKAVAQGADVGLHFVGDGEMLEHLQTKVAQLGLQDRISFAGRVPQARLLEMYHEADAFLFPSLHDSSGNVVLESLSRGLPVICLDLGGPKYFVHEGCGRIVSTQGLSQDGLTTNLAQEVIRFHQTTAPERQAMHDAALAQAASQTWDHQVEQVYRHVQRGT